MFLLHNRKGQVSVQINWIFVLIVGGIILLFFIGIVVKQKSVSNVKHNIAVSEALDSIFVSSQVASGTSSKIKVPSIDVEFDCDNYYIGDFDTGISKTIGASRVLFVPDRLKGKDLVTWSLEWNLPYKIQDFLYVTSNDLRYIVLYEEGNSVSKEFAKELFELMPEMNKEIYEYDSGVFKDESGSVQVVDYKNNYHTRFVAISFTNDLEIDNSFSGKSVSAVSVSTSGKETGRLTFFKNHPTLGLITEVSLAGTAGGPNVVDSTRPYFDYNPDFTSKKTYPSLMGGIFSTSMEMYDCMYKKALTRYLYLTDVSVSRIENLVKEPSQVMVDRQCVPDLYGYRVNDGHVGAYAALLSLKDVADVCSEDLLDVQCSESEFLILTDDLVTRNGVIQDQSCPLVY